MGDWFAVMRIENSFERGLSNVSATYSIRPDGYVGVVNRGFDRAKCRWRSIEGRASFQGAPNMAVITSLRLITNIIAGRWLRVQLGVISGYWRARHALIR
jgi:lipocalin